MGGKISNPTKRAIIKTGSYTGNGADDRNIDIGIDLAAKNNVWLVIKSTGTNHPVHRTEIMVGDITMQFNNTADYVNGIQAFTATGFQVGSDGNVNNNETIYRYIAFWEEP